MSKQERVNRLLPNGEPRYVRCYDEGDNKSADRYTCVFTGRYTSKTGGEFVYLGMSAHPFHPQGVGQHGSSQTQIDVRDGGWGGPSIGRKCHLGVRVTFASLPGDVKRCILQTYCDLWDVPMPNVPKPAVSVQG